MTLIDRWSDVMMDNYGTPPVALASGDGAVVTDESGKTYLDLLGGIAVNILGHRHPAIIEAVTTQLNTLGHTSNLYATAPGIALAAALVAEPGEVAGSAVREGPGCGVGTSCARSWTYVHVRDLGLTGGVGATRILSRHVITVRNSVTDVTRVQRRTQMATTPTDRRDADERKRKRAAIVKFSLAGAAVLGIGAAATSALWTDDAWFAAEASAVDPSTAIDLQGAYVGTTATPQDSDFATADDEPGTGTDFVTIPAEVFADLTAGDSITVPVWIKNMGTSDLVIATPTVTTDGELFAAGGATATLGAAPTSLAAGSAAVSVDLTIELDADADESFGGTTGDVVIGFQGSIANRT